EPCGLEPDLRPLPSYDPPDMEQPATGIVVVDHGSRRAESNELLERVAVALAARYAPEVAFAEPGHLEPAMPDVAGACAAGGRRLRAARGAPGRRPPLLPRRGKALDARHPLPDQPGGGAVPGDGIPGRPPAGPGRPDARAAPQARPGGRPAGHRRRRGRRAPG